MTESTSEYKKRIEEIKQSIENEPYMAKMREDIAEGISKTGIRQATVEEQFQSVLDETTGKDVISAPEIILARGGAQTLGERLDSEKAEVTAQLAQKAELSDVRRSTDIQPINVSEMDTETKQLFTGGAVAVVGLDAVGNENVKSKAIEPINTTFFKRSSNLIDENNVSPSTALNPDTGEPVPSSYGHTLTDYIRITPSTTYTSIDALREVFYDEDKKFISTDVVDGTWVSPSNAIYVRLVLTTVKVGNRAALNIGSELLPFEKYYEYIPEKHFGKSSINTEALKSLALSPILAGFPIDFNFAENKIIFKDVRMTWGNNNVLLNQTVDISTSAAVSQMLLYYDTATGLLATKISTSILVEPLPETGVAICIFRKATQSVWGLDTYLVNGISNGGPVTTSRIEDFAIEPKKTSFFETKSNLFNMDLLTRFRVIPVGSGEDVYHEGFHVSNYIRVLPSTLYTVHRVFRATYYDTSKKYISEDTLSSTETRKFTTPDNAMYVRLSIAEGAADSYVKRAQLNEGSELLPYEKGGEYIHNGFIRLPETSFTDKNTGETTTYDYENNTSFKTSGDVPIIDVDINKTFSSNVVLPENAAVINSALSADIYALYDALMAQYPTYITKTLLGNEPSPSALPIYRYDFKPTRPVTAETTKQVKLLITSGTHPEFGAVWTLYNAMSNICNNWQDDELLEALRFNVHFIIIPMMSPWAYDNRSRVNYNGVDLARNFPALWNQGNFGDITYGGPEPLSEIEAQVINQIMIDNPDLLGVIDFHSFGIPSDGYYFLWGAVANKFTRNVTMSHIQRMDRKWKKEHTYVNQNPDVFIGTANHYAPGGSLGVQADFYNIKLALTYETCVKMPANPNTTNFDSDTLTMGYEAFINFLLTSISETLKRQ